MEAYAGIFALALFPGFELNRADMLLQQNGEVLHINSAPSQEDEEMDSQQDVTQEALRKDIVIPGRLLTKKAPRVLFNAAHNHKYKKRTAVIYQLEQSCRKKKGAYANVKKPTVQTIYAR